MTSHGVARRASTVARSNSDLARRFPGAQRGGLGCPVSGYCPWCRDFIAYMSRLCMNNHLYGDHCWLYWRVYGVQERNHVKAAQAQQRRILKQARQETLALMRAELLRNSCEPCTQAGSMSMPGGIVIRLRR